MTELPSFDNALLLPLLDELSDGVALAEADPWRLVYVNRALAEVLRKDAAALRGMPLETLLNSLSAQELIALAEAMRRGAPQQTSATVCLRTDDSASAPVRLSWLATEERPLLGLVVRLHRALRPALPVDRLDPLTSVPDRRFLLERLAALLHGGRAADRQFALLFIDLDNFKRVNDAHGHLVGDRVLSEVARRLTTCVRHGDHVVRYGGDEFVVLLERVNAPEDVATIVRRIHAALERPVALPQGEFTLSLSIGAVSASADHHSPEELLRDADRAMYAAKQARGGTPSAPARE